MTSTQPIEPEPEDEQSEHDDATTSNREFSFDSQQLENQIAGYDPNTPIQLEQSHQLTQDNELPTPVPTSSKPIPRFFFVGGLLALVGLFLLGLFLALKPRPAQFSSPTPTTDDEPQPETASSEEAKLRARIALLEQQRQINPSAPPPSRPLTKPTNPTITVEPQPTPTPTPTYQPRVQPTPTPPVYRPRIQPVVTPTPPPAPTVSRTRLQPPPAIQPVIQPAPPTTIISSESSFRPPVAITPPVSVKKIDPYERWQELASLGQKGTTITSSAPTPETPSNNLQTVPPSPNSPNSPLSPHSPPLPVSQSPNSPNSPSSPRPPVSLSPLSPLSQPTPPLSKVPLVTIGSSSSTQQAMTPGTWGILNRKAPPPQTQVQYTQIAFGTTAAGVVSVPMVWDEGSGEQFYHRFAVTLTEDILSTDGKVAFSQGTVLIAQAHRVAQGNGFVQASAIAVVYTNAGGTISQHAIPPGTILIRGHQGEPLLAQSYFDNSNEIAQQDLLISLFSGIGRIGEVFTQPESSSSFSSSTVTGTTNSSVTNSREPQIWSAVIDGFFNPLAERLASRSDAQISAIHSRPNLAILPKHTAVSITVNSFVRLQL